MSDLPARDKISTILSKGIKIIDIPQQDTVLAAMISLTLDRS